LGYALGMHHVVSADGTPITYTQQGDGPPLLLVHGIVSNHRMLSGLARRLVTSFTVLTIDRRGRGQSGPIGASGLDAQLDDLLAVADAVGEPCHVFGHSLGAWIALGAAARSSQLLSVTVYEPPPATPLLNTLAGHLEVMVEAGDGEAAIAQLLHGLGANRRLIERLERSPFWPLMTSLAPTIAPELRMLAAAELDLADVAAPVLLLRGSKTPTMVRDVSDALAASLATSRLLDLQGQDHFAPAFAPAAFEAPLFELIGER